MNIKKLSEFLNEKNLPEFRLKQIIKAIYGDSVSSFLEISTLSKDLREQIEKEFQILSFEIEENLSGKKDGSQKALLKLSDGQYIETVLMPGVNEGNWTSCISSQVGCAMNCAFCATGQNGFKRNLTAEEITDQVLFWKQYLKKNKPEDSLSNIVYMGMGEPFMNWEEVKKSISKLLDESLFNFSARHISVSTSGVADKIKKFAKEFPQLNLAVSLIFPNDKTRSEHMPVNKRYSLADLFKSIDYYLFTTNRKVFLEYVMFRGINDSSKDAEDLIGLLSQIEKKHLIHINLISYNTTDKKFTPSPRENIEAFQRLLSKAKVNSSIRKSIGGDIGAACGQLAGKAVDKTKK